MLDVMNVECSYCRFLCIRLIFKSICMFNNENLVHKISLIFSY